MTLIETRNSTYEIDYDSSRIRRVIGKNPPTESFAPDGEWKTFQEIEECLGGLIVIWPTGKCTVTSAIKSAAQ